MQFHAEFFPKAFTEKIKHTDQLLLVGSCFTEQIGSKLAVHKFSVLENPNGILFNPASIAKAVGSYAEGKLYSEDELFYHTELWGSWEHHTKFSNINKEEALAQINSSQAAANEFIKTADWILLTLGSAFVYERREAESKEGYADVAANCHKIPTDKFNRRLLETEEIKTLLLKMMDAVRKVNPAAKFIFTISPVRHLREGFIENNRSKAALINAVHAIVNNEAAFYFPAYELVIDDLRDYRFFAEDMVHPNYAATNYVWEKFVPVAIDEPSQLLMKEINEVNAAKSHKAFNPASQAHRKFLLSNLEKVRSLSKRFPYIDFTKEEAFFSSPQ
jgi:lysophospholipase L1-like esterase